MCKCKCCCNFYCNVSGLLGRESFLLAQDVSKCVAFDELHRHEIGISGGTPVIDADNVWMVQVGSRLGLTAETLNKIGVGGELREENLDGYGTVEQNIAGQENISHSTATYSFVDLVSVVDDRFLFVRHARNRLVP